MRIQYMVICLTICCLCSLVNAATPPTISNISAQVMSSDSVKTLTYAVRDVDSPANSLQVTATSSNTTLLKTAKILSTQTGNDRMLTITPEAGKIGTTTITLTVTDNSALSASTSFVLTVNRYKPDLYLRPLSNPSYTGISIVSLDGATQTVGQTAFGGTMVKYYVQIQNLGNVPDALTITGPAAPGGWTVVYKNTADNSIITDQLTTTGWTTPALAANGSAKVEVDVTPGVTLVGGALATQTMKVTSSGDPTKIDVGVIQTTALQAAPTLTSFSPSSGPIGQIVTLTGTNFTGVTSVAFNGAATTIFSLVNTTSITAAVPTGASSGKISVTTPEGIAISTSDFTILPAPTITSFTPNSGLIGTLVTLTGDNFPGATVVTFNSIPATNITLVNATTLTVTVPSGATNGPISIITSGGIATSSTSFTISQPPTITIINSQTMGSDTAKDIYYIVQDVDSPANNLLVTATSSNTTLLKASKILSTQTGNDRVLTITPEAGKTGSTTITLTVTDADSLTASSSFMLTVNRYKPDLYLRPLNNPSYTGINIFSQDGTTQTIGQTALSGTMVKYYVQVQNLGSVPETLTINGPMAPSGWSVVYKNTADGSIITDQLTTSGWTTPMLAVNASAKVEVDVTPGQLLTGGTVATQTIRLTSSGDPTKQDVGVLQTTAIQTPPKIISFTPSSGLVGTVVTITGTKFLEVTSVSVNGIVLTNMTVMSATTITATIPSNATSGKITVTTPEDTATSVTDFTVILAPTLTSFTPTRGLLGSILTLTGTNLTGATIVAINGVATTNITLLSATSIMTTIPDGASSGKITVSTPGGIAISEIDFNITQAPIISTISAQVMSSDSVKTLNYTVQDIDTPTESLLVSVTSSNTTLLKTAKILSSQTGNDRVLTITPEAGKTGSTTITVTVSDENAQTACTSFVLTVNRYKPDLYLRPLNNPSYTGISIYSMDGSTQTVGQTAIAGTMVKYYVQVQNLGSIPESLTINVSAMPPNWTVAYKNTADGSIITDQLTTSGWTTPVLAVNGSAKIEVNVTPGVTLLDGIVATQKMTVISSGDPTKKDMGVLQTMAIQSVPTLTSFTPTNGSIGTLVTLTGANLAGTMSVRVNSTMVTAITILSATSIVITIPNDATSGKISISTPGGSVTSTDNFSVTGVAGAPGINTIDNAAMVWVPAGSFNMGSIDGVGSIHEHMGHYVTLAGYWIYKYEVTVAQYRAFCSTTSRVLPPFPTGYSWEGKSGWSDLTLQQHPIVNVSWYDAKAYADWAGVQIPTEAQWEYAARGPSGRNYPWGGTASADDLYNGWDQMKCANGSNSHTVGKSTWPVGSFLAGKSWCGADDLVGNVWEWCTDWWSDSYSSTPAINPAGPETGTTHVIKGASWYVLDGYFTRSAYRNYHDPGNGWNGGGFRCVMPSTEPE